MLLPGLSRLSTLFALATLDAGGASAGPVIQTTAGPIRADRLGLILPHEHIITDLRGPDAADYGQVDAEDALRVMRPLLVAAKERGVELLTECSSVGVGRNVALLARLARETGLYIVVPTGVYGRDRYAPRAYREMSQGDLAAWMIGEITVGIEGTSIKAGFIKLATSGSELTSLEERLLRAAATAVRQTGVAIASHTPSGCAAARQADILQAEGVPLERFIWVHAQAEPDAGYRPALAARGVYLELDSIGSSPQEDARLLDMVQELLAQGYVRQILLSHDAGWYQPGQPNGGQQRPYTALIETFIPSLRAAGLSEAAIRTLTVENPRRALTLRR